MSVSWIRSAVLAVALAVMPFQGIAATLTVLLCHGDAQAHAGHVGTVQHDHGSPDDSGHGHDHDRAKAGQHAGHGQVDGVGQPDESAGAANLMYHLCCNLSASISTSVDFAAVVPEFPVRTSAPETRHDVFVPEQPQRPPLA